MNWIEIWRRRIVLRRKNFSDEEVERIIDEEIKQGKYDEKIEQIIDKQLKG